jgi:DNA-directed RNA polymerase specialized sigma24 family protein
MSPRNSFLILQKYRTNQQVQLVVGKFYCFASSCNIMNLLILRASAAGPRIALTEAMQGNVYAEAFQTGFGATRRFLISRGAALEDAEEIAQAAWARGWEFREQLRDPDLVSYWVNSIARNLYRARFRSAVPVPLEHVQEPSYAFDTSPIDLRKLLEACSNRDRALLERTLQGYTAEELSEAAGISSTGIRVRLLRARQSLRAKFTPAAA